MTSGYPDKMAQDKDKGAHMDAWWIHRKSLHPAHSCGTQDVPHQEGREVTLSLAEQFQYFYFTDMEKKSKLLARKAILC